MTEQAADAELIASVRTGDDEAFAQLYLRHRNHALRFARALTGRSGGADDLVADAFARVLAALKSGNGPDEAFRPYLLSAVRNIYLNQARRTAREQPMAEPAGLLPQSQPADPAVARDENRLVATAFKQLPERWQVVLWHTEVEGESPAKVGSLLGINANAAAALAYRAREGLRERYLQAHLASATDQTCQPTVDRLAAYARGRLSRAEAQRVRQHLDGCARCRLLFVDLADVNSRLGALIGPIVLGGAAAGYVASHGTSALGLATLAKVFLRPEAQVAAALAATTAVVAVALGPTPAPDAAGPPANRTVPHFATPGVARSPTGGPVVMVATATPAPGGAGSASAGPADPSATPTSTRPIVLTANLELGLFERGLPGQVLLSVDNPSSGPKAAGVDVTATLSLPAGVTLRVANAGNGWVCEPAAAAAAVITCQRQDLWPGWKTRAVVQVRVSPDAASGPVSALLTGPDIAPVIVATDGL